MQEDLKVDPCRRDFLMKTLRGTALLPLISSFSIEISRGAARRTGDLSPGLEDDPWEIRKANPYERPFHFLYAIRSGKRMAHRDGVILEQFKSFKRKPTMASQVILNADPSGKPWPHVDGAFIGVRKEKGAEYMHPKFPRMGAVLENDPGIKLVCNYENAGRHVELTEMGRKESIRMFSLAADMQNTSSVPFKWAPPWTKNYDPIKMKTMEWIKEKYARINHLIVE
jgi:hypothetical protein